MKRQTKVALAIAIVFVVSAGIALASIGTVGYFADGIGTSEGIIIGSDVTSSSSTRGNFIDFDEEGVVRANEDLNLEAYDYAALAGDLTHLGVSESVLYLGSGMGVLAANEGEAVMVSMHDSWGAALVRTTVDSGTGDASASLEAYNKAAVVADTDGNAKLVSLEGQAEVRVEASGNVVMQLGAVSASRGASSAPSQAQCPETAPTDSARTLEAVQQAMARVRAHDGAAE